MKPGRMIHCSLKKLTIAVLPAWPLLLSAQTSKIRINMDRTIGAIDPKIYGEFMEPLAEI
jgi:alpha-N-arabinofuranosidase